MSRLNPARTCAAMDDEQLDPVIERELSAQDLLSLEGARTLKQRIERLWRERGRNITIHIVGESRGPGLGVVFGLISDAVNGTPPEARQ